MPKPNNIVKELDADLLISRAYELSPNFNSRQKIARELRQLPLETIDEMRHAGFQRLFQPKVFGGAESHFDGFVKLVPIVAAACSSTGWVLAQYIIHNHMIGYWPEKAQKEVWESKPDANVSGVLIPGCGNAEISGDGYKLSGKWPFASGCDGADFMIFSAFCERNEKSKESLQFIVKKESVEFVDNWHTIGLEGTGSKEARINDLFVPQHMALSLEDTKGGVASPGSKFNSGALYRLGAYSMFSVVQSSTSLGIATGVYENFLKIVRGRIAKQSGKQINEFGTTQVKLAESAACLHAARLLMLDVCDEARRIATTGKPADIETKSKFRGSGTYSCVLARRAVDLVWDLAGGHGIFDLNPISQGFRDMKCAQNHISQNWDANGGSHGRVLLGLPPSDIAI